jgi:hypothetical protein
MAKVITRNLTTKSASNSINSFPSSSISYSKMLETDPALIEYLFGDQGYDSPLGLSGSQEKFDWYSTTNPFQRIVHLRDLEEDWDGYGSSEFTGTHIRRALDIYSRISKYFNLKKKDILEFGPFVSPSSDGCILFDWSSKKFLPKSLELYISSDLNNPLTYLKIEADIDFEEEDKLSDDQVSILLDWLFSDS